MLPTLVALDVFNRSLSEGRPEPTVAAEVERETDYFRDTIGEVESADDLLADFRLYRFAMTAFDLSETLESRAIVQRVLSENPQDQDALSRRLQDSRFRTMATSFDLGKLQTLSPQVESLIEQRAQQPSFLRPAIEPTATNEGLRLAADFLDTAETLTSWDQVLNDDNLSEVVFTALDIPIEIQLADDDELIEELEKRYDIADFQMARKREDFAKLFARQYDVEVTGFIDQVAEQYRVVRSEIGAGETNNGVRLASYFGRQAENITSWFQVLAEEPLRQVVFTALSIPLEAQGMDVDRLAEQLAERYDIADFQDPEERERFIERFAVQFDLENGTGLGPSSGALAILQSASASLAASPILNTALF
ncbi:MAG: DUF1217 domain-containing protein [Pseudomonadota bacterium]